MSIFNQQHQIEDDFQQELEYIIEEYLGDDSSNSQKEQLFDSISHIFNKISEKCQNQYYEQNYLPYTFNCQSINNKRPSINIIIPTFIPNSFPQLPQGYYQPTINQFNMQNPMMPQFTNQMQMIQSPQFTQQVSLYPFDLSLPLKTKSSKKGRSKSSKKHDKRSKSKKDSKHKSKSETTEQKDSKSSEIKIFSFNESDPLNGIFKFLTVKTHGNIHDNGTIEVKSDNILTSHIKGEGQSRSHPKNLLNDDSKSFYRPDKSTDNFYIQFDFKNMEVEISSYTIRTAGSGHANLKNWVFLISDDQSKWTQVDIHINYIFSSQTVNFEVNTKRFVRYARISQIGPPSDSSFRLWINAVEFYGKLKMPK